MNFFSAIDGHGAGTAPQRALDLQAKLRGAWVAFCRQPGDATFAEMFEASKGLVFSICTRMLRDNEDASDALQLVYCHLLETARFDPAAESLDIEELSRTLAERESKTILKRRERAVARHAPVDLLDFVATDGPSPADAASTAQVRDILASMVDGLRPKLREPVFLFFFQGLNHVEISSALGIPERTARNRVNRGLELLSAKLKAAGLERVLIVLVLAAATDGLFTSAAAAALAGGTGHWISTATDKVAGVCASAMRAVRASSTAARWKAAAATVVIIAAAVGLRPSPPADRGAVAAPPAAQQPPPSVRSEAAAPDEPNSPSRLLTAGGAVSLPPQQPGSGTGALTGRVVSLYTGRPIAGVAVHADTGKTVNAAAAQTTVFTDQEGRFALPGLPTGPASLQFDPPPTIAPKSVRAQVAAAGNGDIGDIELAELASIRGRMVTIPSNEGVAGVTVQLRDAQTSLTPTAVTQADGSFEFAGLSHNLYALVSMERQALYQQVTLTNGGPTDVVVPVGDTTIRGRVVRAGQPCADVNITAVLGDQGSDFSRGTSTTTDGSFELRELPAGAWKMQVRPGEDALADQSLNLDVSTTVSREAVCNVELPSGSLVGRVVAIDGRPLGGVVVAAENAAAARRLANKVPHMHETTTAADGTFRFEGLAPGSYGVGAVAPAIGMIGPETVSVPFAGENRQVTLAPATEPGGSLLSVAVDLRTGAPVEGAWCRILRDGKPVPVPARREGTTAIRIDNLRPGHYTVESSAFGYTSSVHEVDIPSGGHVNVTDVLEEAGALRLIARDAGGHPVAGAKCTVFPVDGTAALATPPTGTTEADGTWTVRGLPPGEYLLTAEAGVGRASAQLRIRAHDQTHRTVALGDAKDSAMVRPYPPAK